MKKTILLSATLLLASPAFAQDLNCADTSDMNQGELNECSYQSYKTADRALNTLWPKVKSFTEAITAENKDNMQSHPDASKSLLNGQRAWLKYRDAQCETEAARYAGGSIQPLIANSCLADLTRKRTEELTLLMQTN